MHGRPRVKVSGPPNPERVKAAEQKAALFGQLAGEVLLRRAARQYDAESLALAGKLLELHPEVYTVWNYRREALAPVLEAGGEAAVAAVAAELALTERALAKNPKSYSTWHHRKWAVAKGFCSLEHELKLVSRLLDVDERNFHGWGYRRFVVQLMGTPAERELDYAALKINQNFSNYSAWHSRTVLLPVLHAGDAGGDAQVEKLMATLSDGASLGTGTADAETLLANHRSDGTQQPQQPQQDAQAQSGAHDGAVVAAAAPAASAPQPRLRGSASAPATVPKAALDEEYELVKQAFWTEPEDQSGWFYHRWLLGCSLAHWEQACGADAKAAEARALLAVLEREQRTCEKLLEAEPEAKWALLTLTRLKELRLQVLHSCPAGSAPDGNAPDGTAPADLAAEVAEGYARLKQLDPLRRGYYVDAEEGRAHVVAKPAAA